MTASPQTWTADDLLGILERAGFSDVRVEVLQSMREQLILPEQVEAWFSPGSGRPSYADRLGAYLSPGELERLHGIYRQQLAGKTVAWRSQTAYLTASRPST